MRLCTACARVRRSLFMRPSRWNTHTHMVFFIVTMNAHSCIDAHSYTEDRITDACARHRRAHVCAHVRARVGAGIGAHASAPNRASPSRRRGPRVASARRRSARRRRSTRTSARGTPRPSPRCPRYAPLPARRRATAGVADALGRASMRRGRFSMCSDRRVRSL